jgi:hypothetical protein
MAATTAPAARSRLRPGACSCPGGSSAAAASPGGSQASQDGYHRSSRMSAARPCWASTSRAMAAAVAAPSAVAAYKKTLVFPAVTETSSPARLRSRSQMESAKTGFPEADCPQAIRLTRHSSSTLQAYAQRVLRAPHHHALGACRRAELPDLAAPVSVDRSCITVMYRRPRPVTGQNRAPSPGRRRTPGAGVRGRARCALGVIAR